MTTVADNLVSLLEANGIERIYGLSGDSLNGFTDAIRKSGGLAWEHVRNEEAGAFAAAAEAALTSKLAVCVGSCGPGNTHLVQGLFDAQKSRVPVLAIAAHIPLSEVGSGYFQETHPQVLFAECSVYCELVSNPEMAPRIFEMAMRAAVEQNGVSVVIVPGEIFLAQAKRTEPSSIAATSSIVRPDDRSLDAAAKLLNEGHRVTILGGYGTAGTHDDVIALADTLKSPIVHALRGKEHLEYDNPFDVGLTGLLGFSSGYKAIVEADTLLMLGTDFPYRQFYPEHANIIQVDIRGERLGRRTKIDLGLVGTVKDTIAALIPRLAVKTDRSHLDRALKHYRKARSALNELAVNDHDRTPIHPQYVAKVVSELASEDAVFTTDVGSPVAWAARYVSMNGKRRLLGSFNHGTMATALPHAIGAQATFPRRQVIALAGDGGLTMLFGELLTLIQNQLPVKIILFNNSSLNFVELEMKAAGLVNYGTDLINPNFADVAAAIGLFTKRVEHPAELESAVTEALAHDGPALVEVLTARQELSVPPAITAEQAKGFTLYAIRTILSGRGEELLDLVNTNVARRILD